MNSNVKKTIKNIIKVGLSNITTIISGVIVGFVLPKIIGVTNYGYYKTFSLYISYVSFFQFGISEGLYLKYGNKSFEELDKREFKFYSQFLIIFQLFISLIFIFLSIIVMDSDYCFIFVCVSLFILFQNVTTYYQYISQITNRFNELSLRNVLKSLLTIISIVCMWVYFHYNNSEFLSYKVYTICYLLIFAFLCFWYIFTYRNITFGKGRIVKKEDGIFSLIKLGFPLLVSNLCSTLIFTIDRQFVSMFFDIDTYGSYAFAYNMLSLVTVATSSIATVLYPTMARMKKENLEKNFSNFLMVFNIFIFLCITIYFPLYKFIYVFFQNQPKYIESLPVFRVILPSLALSCSITVIIHNYYKSYNFNTTYFVIVVVTLVLSILLNVFAYLAFKSVIAISAASVIITFIWYLMSLFILKRKIQINFLKCSLYIVICILTFYMASMIKIWWIGMILYFLPLIIITLLFNWRLIKNKFIFKNIWKGKL